MQTIPALEAKKSFWSVDRGSATTTCYGNETGETGYCGDVNT
jgi:hypothetical protein